MSETPKRRRLPLWLKIGLWVVAGLVVLFGAIQLVPYGREHSNPPATTPFQWNDAQAEAIARESCYDCHSNETNWWWATYIAPFSWLTQNDTENARQRMNFSEWSGGPTEEGMLTAINDGMPPTRYVLTHWGARLSDEEKQTLVKGYGASLAANQPAEPSEPTGEAVSIIDSRCGACHSTQVALDYRTDSADEAAALIDDMVNRGANVNDQQKQTLVDYFTR
jgi:hypothetical protein